MSSLGVYREFLVFIVYNNERNMDSSGIRESWFLFVFRVLGYSFGL